MNEELEVLRSELAIEKEKRHTMGEALRRAESSTGPKLSGTKSLGSSSSEMSSVLKKVWHPSTEFPRRWYVAQYHNVISLSYQVTVLEMKELNERQRANHASRMYDQIKGTVDSIEARNAELEQKFAEVLTIQLYRLY